ncbi:MAG: tyrosine-type recombinase/integrase [Lacrimispora sphenoides]
MLEINQWIESKSLKKTSTGKEYAKKIVVYLNYLHNIGVEYDDATNRHVKQFIQFLLYGSFEGLKIKSIETEIICATAARYVTVVTELYKWLDSTYETNIIFQTRTDMHRAKKSFLYGQIYSSDYQYIINGGLSRQKNRREYIKWYSDDERDALCGGFKTLRDEAVFMVTLEGFRIDEVLSIKLENYNPVEQSIQPMRSKGRQDAQAGRRNPLRVTALPAVLCKLLDRYIQTERMIAENESGVISDSLFINLQRGNGQASPLSYGNYYKILKRCAARVGIDPKKIRTHSGRSTKVMEYLENQALHPEDGITDAIIMESFGWRSSESINHYRDHNNQIIAGAVAKKLHRRKGGWDGSDD